MKLSRKRRAFISEYLKDFDGKNAAIRAGYSPTRAASTACDLLKIEIIRNTIDEYLDGLKMTAEEALQLLGKTAREANSESVKLRALEKVIDVHGLTKERLDGELTFRVIYGDKDSAEGATPEAEGNQGSPGQAESNL